MDDGRQRILLDCGPGVPQSPYWDSGPPLAATFISHLHADHCLGLAELRWSSQPDPIPVYLPAAPGGPGADGGERAGLPSPLLRLTPVPLRPFEKVNPAPGMAVTAIPLQHGGMPTFGWLVQGARAGVAYLADTRGLPPDTWALVEDVVPDCAIIDATCRPGEASPGHHDVDEALVVGARTGAATVVLTHIAHHNWPQPALERYVAHRARSHADQQVLCAYDGLTMDVVPAAELPDRTAVA